MDLDFPGETSGASFYFAPGFALGYAALLADLWGPEKAEDAVRFFAAHDFTDTIAFGICPDHCHPWPPAISLPRTQRIQGWKDPCAN
ncbi:MAG: hypothetical protein FVQ06_01535 [candidate division NC10 bacterium]|nr:hypothetical protein [candidate division NC10 bacterium]